MSDKNDFYEKVWQVASQIPYGKVTSYGAIAEFLGAKSAARMVGYAMNHSFSADFSVPAHRVVNRNGLLTGKHHFGSSNTMQELLECEGHTIENNKIVDFKDSFLHPCDFVKVDGF